MTGPRLPGLAPLLELRFRLLVRRLQDAGGPAEGVARVITWVLVLPAALVFAGLVAAGSFRTARAGVGLRVDVPVAAMFFGIWQAWTAVALVLADRESLDLRRFLGYPLRPGRVWLLGLVAGLVGDPFAVFWLTLLVGAFAGAMAARPGAWLLPLGLDLALFAAASAALIALLEELLGRLSRLRLLRELAIVAGLAGWIGLAAASRASWPELLAVLRRARWVFFPPALAAGAAQHLYAGRVVPALPFLAALAAAAAATGWLAWRLALRAALSGETGAAPPRSGAGAAPGRAWPGFVGPVVEKELRYLLRHPVGRIGLLLVPALGGLAAWKLAPLLPPDAPVLRALPLFGLTVLAWMVPQDLWLNAFGWDRGGARALFLAPLEPRRVLAGKNLAMAAYATALLAGAAAAAVAAGGWPPTWALAGAAALHLALGPMLLGAGNLVSIWNPRASGFTLRRAKNLPALSGLAGMAIVSGAVGLLALPALLAARLDEPWVLVGGWVAAAAAAWAAYLTTLRRVGALLEARRERLLAEVCGDEG
ncbi:MAG TPA: hypothetical protein VH880_13405 [Anaeromyxobacteraceae bacterium]